MTTSGTTADLLFQPFAISSPSPPHKPQENDKAHTIDGASSRDVGILPKSSSIVHITVPLW